MLTQLNMTRLIYVNLLLLAGLTDWLVSFFHPEENAGNWLAGVAGAFLLRLLIQVSARKHLTGWLVGTIAAFLWASTVHRKLLPGWDEAPVWGLVGFLADLVLQIVVYLITYARDHPAEAFDAGLERVEKVTSVWTRIKAPFMDLLNSMFHKPS